MTDSAADDPLEGSCLCGGARWKMTGDPGPVTACNCTLCRRYGALWAYDYEGERIVVSGVTDRYARDREDATLEILFCPTCAGLLAWRGLRIGSDGRRRMAVNVRLTDPARVGHLPIEHFDGLGSFEDRPRDGRCVRDMWY